MTYLENHSNNGNPRYKTQEFKLFMLKKFKQKTVISPLKNISPLKILRFQTNFCHKIALIWRLLAEYWGRWP